MNVQPSPVSSRPEPRAQHFWWYIPVTITMLGAGILACHDLMMGQATASTWACLIFIGTVTCWVACTSKDTQ